MSKEKNNENEKSKKNKKKKKEKEEKEEEEEVKDEINERFSKDRSSCSSVEEPWCEGKIKVEKSLRFTLPDFSPSEDSFTSAKSYNLGGDDYEDFSQNPKETSYLKRYIHSPLHHAYPRIASPIPCFSGTPSTPLAEESRVFLSAATSSRQLFEILRHSPTPSDADLNLINAAYLRKLDAVKEAINNGADVNTYRDRQTPLLIATEIGDDRMVEYLLTVPKINPDFQNVFGQTPLIVAVRNSFDTIVRLLLTYNANVNIPDNMGKTPLHASLFRQRPKLAKLLLAYGADYEKADCFGEKPMYTAAVKKPHLECLMILLKAGASPEYCNVSGIPLLSRAILNLTEFKILETLVAYGASVNSLDVNTKKAPLHFAAMTNDLRVCKFLVRQGADVNLKTVYNFNPFEEALFHRSIEVAEFLAGLTNNANVKSLTALKDQQT